MDLDTSAKGFNKLKLKKIICIFLAFVTFTLSANMIFKTIITGQEAFVRYDEDFTAQSWTDTNAFSNEFYSDANYIINHKCSTVLFDDEYEKKLSQMKEDVVNKVYKSCLAIDETWTNAEEIDRDDDTIIFSDRGTNTEVSTIIRVNLDEIKLGNGEVFKDLCFEYNYYDYGEGCYRNDEVFAKKYISERYDKFADDIISSYTDWHYMDWEENSFRNSLRYYVSFGDNYNSNMSLKDGEKFFDKEQFDKTADVIFTSLKGKMTYKGINEDLAKNIYESCIKGNVFAENADIYIYINVSEILKISSIINVGLWNDSYISLYRFYPTLMSYYDCFKRNIAIEAVLMLISFVLGIYALTLAGKRENGENRLFLTDKLPYVVHFVISGVLIFLATSGMSWASGNIYNAQSLIFTTALTVFGAIVWVLLYEFCASVARSIHARRPLKECSISVWIYRLYKKISNVIINVFKYKPKTMARNMIVFSVIFFLVNAVLAAIIVLLFSTFDGFFVFLSIALFIGDVAGNVFVLTKIAKYIKNLDSLIYSSSIHEEPALDTEKLELSLATLADSMKYTNIELQEAIAKAVKDERLRSELITNVSHDLKTPLTSIITYVDLLSKCDIEDEKALEYIKVLDDKGAKLKRLIDDLIEASKVTSGNVTVNLTTINLKELCLQSTVDAQPDFEKAGLDLIIKECENPPIVTADGAKTFRVIENLLSNARKYSARASRVYVDVYKENGFGIFEIKNVSAQPLDITPDELTERFVRGDKSRNQEGNGLGLSIAKELCLLQNGGLELIIDGDLFKARVKLPIAQAEQ